MSKEKRRVPKLRFPGFTEDWEQRKLGSIGSTYTGLSGKTKEDFGHGEAQYITYLNVFQNTISDITMTDKVEIDTTQNEVKYGDVLFTTSSETPEEVGMSSVWLGATPNIYLNSFCFGFRPNQKIDPYFLGYSLRAPYMRDKIKILAQGISRYNISKNKVMELEISLPNNEEQKLLGTFLQRIDLIITLHQRKLEHLNLKKKALLQKLFPKNGERYPELRFPGFADAWEQRKLGSIGSTYTGLSGKTKEDFGHGEAQYITYLNVFQNTISDITMTDKVEIDTTQNEVKYGDVLFTTSSETPEEVGMSSVWLGATPNIYLNSFCFGFRPNQKIDPYFLGYSLRAPYMRDKIKILAQGISRYNISKNKVMELEISLPNNEEQKLLGTFLQRIDLIITLHQRKLEHLQLQKKALLQQLFI